MTIRYKVGRTTLGGQERLYPRLTPGKAITAKQFERKVADRAARGLADVAAVLIAAREVLLEELRDEQAVRVPGMGRFSLSLKGQLGDDQRLVTGSAQIKINFQAERALVGDVNEDLTFEFVGE